MNSNLKNITSAQMYFDRMLKGTLSKNIYYSMPTTISAKVDEFVFVDFANGIEDLSAYGSGSVNLFLCTKAMKDGRENFKAMNNLETSLNKIILNHKDDSYGISIVRKFQDFDERRNFHCTIVVCNLIII